ncbi:RsmB/NOP family class I SAM-dependent RNA methyltransferase [Bifidobacterium simiarum]|uniref:RsmB/NOP family class I SAM-dependent RNA methyltransferase n=1 Tax=Bifidobacterium simiarum TaxID=2045441 RepID=UPI001F0B6E32|nr:transcription antitermination factor NusB [Bifidobacterium simiarum]
MPNGKSSPKGRNRAAQGREPKNHRASGRKRTNGTSLRHANPRRLAYEVTMRVEEQDGFTNLLLPKALAAAQLSGSDAGFVTELVYGTQRWRGLLDAIVAAAARRRIEDIDPGLLVVLRLGVYQTLFMDVPAHAAVDETVELARRLYGRGRAGFVNAVMHKVADRDRHEWESLVVSRVPKDRPHARLAVRYSHPEWIVDELDAAWRAAGYADDPAALPDMLAADNATPPVTLVARPGLIAMDELIDQLPDHAEYRMGLWSPYALRVHGVNPDLLQAVHAGQVGVEDEGSQLAALALAHAPLAGFPNDAENGADENATDDRHWLDMCAGPGGKTALLGALAASRGATLTANEPSHHRAELVRRNVSGLAEGTVDEVLEVDGRELGERFPGRFDRILVDAPCSGLGSLRRRPEARWRKRAEDITALADIQRGLLDSALNAVRSGGVVAYVTCSPALAETRAIVDAALAGRQDVERLDAAAVLRGINPDLPLPEAGGDVQLFEQLHDTDQMFIALLRRR